MTRTLDIPRINAFFETANSIYATTELSDVIKFNVAGASRVDNSILDCISNKDKYLR